MKKIIVISLILCSMIFFISGVYLIRNIRDTTNKQDFLIMLHQVEILRGQLLIHIRQVQNDFNLRNTRFARNTDTLISDVMDMQKTLNKCFECHHTPDVERRLGDLKGWIETYKSHISKVLTIQANGNRTVEEENQTFQLADNLVDQVGTMVHFTTEGLEKKTQSILKDIYSTKIIIYILIVLTPFVVAFISYVFTRQLTQPVKTLLEATRKLRDGDLDYRIVGLKDEFGEVAASFNEMTASLNEQMKKMQRTEQMVIIGELAAGLAHEIKNPLAGIKVSIELISQESGVPENDREIGLQAIQKIKQIELLIKSLLDFAKPPKPEFTSVEINKLLDKSISFSTKHPFFSSDNPRGIHILKNYDQNLPLISADPVQLDQAFLNLFLNAIDSMPEGGELGIKTSHDLQSNSVVIEISDTGKGMDEDIIDKVFQPFFTTKSHGTGLGLAITKRFIEQNLGEITVESKSKKGTLFKIFLPLEPR
jgi:signal transduction histidine kinase